EGQHFQSRKACTRHIHDFALAQGKRAVTDQKRSDGASFRYVCNNARSSCEHIEAA
ncbi:TPA: hypothetical protein N0F65_011321, partial [Lagenidium giganteum]